MPLYQPYSRFNSLQQDFDMAGSAYQNNNRTLTDETGGLGLSVSSGATPSITTVTSGVATVTGLTGMTQNSVGEFLTLAGFTNAGNNGTFLIVAFNGATSVGVSNSAGVALDAGATWTQRNPYVINDDLDFERTDRTAIKGVNYDQPIPVYQRPTAVGTNVPANLANIATKTTDAVAYCVNRGQFKWAVEQTLTEIYGVGSLKHADAVDKTGVPCFDAAPFVSDWNSAYVEVTNFLTGEEMYVLAGGHAGEKIFGLTFANASTSPDDVEIHWYSAPPGSNIVTSSTLYTWEQGGAGAQSGTAAITVTPGANGASAITGLTGATFAGGDVGNWVTFAGMTNSANNGSFVVLSVQGPAAITVQNHAAVSETSAITATWAEFLQTQKTLVDLTYGYNERLDMLDQNAFRFPLVSGLVADSDLRQSINDILSTDGWPDGTTDLSTHLTNTTSNFPFFSLGGGAADTVVNALNVLNAAIGSQTYTGPYLVDGNTITQNLQAISNAVSASTVTRYIERLASAVPANMSHVLPGGATYNPDVSNNGKGLFVYWNGVLRDPGQVANGDDYAETDATHITPYWNVKAGQHINYFVA